MLTIGSWDTKLSYTLLSRDTMHSYSLFFSEHEALMILTIGYRNTKHSYSLPPRDTKHTYSLPPRDTKHSCSLFFGTRSDHDTHYRLSEHKALALTIDNRDTKHSYSFLSRDTKHSCSLFVSEH